MLIVLSAKNFGIFMPTVGPCYNAIKPAHTHPSYSFIYPFDDYCKVKISTKKEVASKIGYLFAFSPDIPHEEIISDDFSRYIVIIINKNIFKNEYQKYSKTKNQVLDGDLFKTNQEILLLAKEFMLEYESKMPGYEAVMESIVLRLTHTIIRTILNFEIKTENINLRFNIDKAIEYMNMEFNRKISIDKLAKIANLSPSHFFKIFKDQTGKPPLDYLIDL